jgi:hypothetical protein
MQGETGRFVAEAALSLASYRRSISVSACSESWAAQHSSAERRDHTTGPLEWKWIYGRVLDS